jgi:uncharacterized protein (TIGR02265 family)
VGERIIFGTSVEGMLRALGPDREAPEVKAALVALGVNPERMLPGYNVPTYVKLMEFIGAHRFPTLKGEARDRELGREFIRGFAQTLVGKATMAMGRVLGPRRATMRLTRSMRTVNNYSTSGCSELNATSMEVWCEPVLRPWYYVGVFEEGGRSLHGPSYSVELRKFEPRSERAEFLISW